MSWQDFWEVQSDHEARIKVIGQPDEDDGLTDANVNHVLSCDIANRGRALEIGAGYGRLMAKMSNSFQDVYGVDISATLIEKSKPLLERVPNARPIIRTNGILLPFEDNFFDFVYSFICFQHMPTLDIVQRNVREIARVLKSGGTCRIQTVCGASITRGDEPTGSGYDFQSPALFLEEFHKVGLSGSAEMGAGHFQWIWVTAKK